MDGLKTGDKAILLITHHRQFGAMIAPWEAEREAAGWFVLQSRLNWPVSEDGMTEEQQVLNGIISLSQSFSDAEIHRQFARKSISMKDFLKGVPEELLLLQIRPFIDRQMDKILRIAVQHDIPIFEHEDSPRVYFKNRLLATHDPAEPWFCFTKTTAGSNYVLELIQQEKKIVLKSPGNKIICRNPCWFMAENRLLHFPDGFDGKKIEPFLAREAILIPASAEKKYFETFILKTLKTGQVKATGFKVQALNPDRRIELSAESDWQGKAVLVIWFRYGEKRIMAGKSQKVFIDLKMDDDEVVFYKTERDPAWEAAMISGCQSAGLTMFNGSILCLPAVSGGAGADMYRLVEWLNVNSENFREKGIVISTDRAPVNFFTGTVSAEIRVEPGADWFDVKASVYFGGLEVPFVRLRQYLLDGIREFPLPGGETVVLPWEWFTRYGDLNYFSVVVDDHLRLPLHHVQIIRDLDLPQNEPLSERLRQLDPAQAMPANVPETLHAVLRPYQEEGLQWLKFLHEHRFGGILADDMGLGKTIQALALLLSCNASPHATSLIIMPASLIHNWRNEIRRFAPSLSVWEHSGMQRRTSAGFFGSTDVIITTYGTLRNDLALFMRYQFHYIILDESQVIKNPSALISRAVCQLKSEHRLVLTGTPIENSLTDLWSQLEFLNPGMLGTLPRFQKRYVSKWSPPVPGKGELHLSAEKQEQEMSNLVSDHLKQLVAPFILRRTKKEAEPDLPPLTIKELYCEMTESQRSRYEQEKSAVRNEVLEQIESGISSSTSLVVLKALIRLRQMANHPALADPEYRADSGKFDEIIRVALTLREEGHKTLVFSSFVKHLQLVATHLSLAGVPFSMLTGATTNREMVVRKFQEDPDQQFFLISLKAGGTGLNLTEAGYVMMLDPWWNPAAEMQAINRAHRIGQDKKVIAYKFITSGTIEEKMLILQQRKQVLSDTFLPSGNPLKDLSREELSELFG
ncbi:MAG: DEAD/DEAH box helicase [Bacteroidetes bacterium]|nr:DEAD/DEAH box helicase [Bacteroidota bacterium]